jgi:hypothetical protein
MKHRVNIGKILCILTYEKRQTFSDFFFYEMDSTKFPKIFNESNKGLALINFRKFWYFVKLIVA